MTSIDKCKGILINDIKKFLREQKKTNKNIKLSGNKKELCETYLKYKQPVSKQNSKSTSPQSKPNISKQNVVKLIEESIKSIYKLSDLSSLRTIIQELFDDRFEAIKKANSFVNAEDVWNMMKNKVDMKDIVKKIEKINDFDTQHELGSEVIDIDPRPLYQNYSRIEQGDFMVAVKRSSLEDWLVDIWEEQDRQFVKSLINKKLPMHNVIITLQDKMNEHGDYWMYKLDINEMKTDLKKNKYIKKQRKKQG